MIGRILIPVIVLTLLPYWWIDKRYLRSRAWRFHLLRLLNSPLVKRWPLLLLWPLLLRWRRYFWWIQAAIVIGYSGFLASERNFLPDNPMLVDIWFWIMALFTVPQFVFTFCSFAGWCCMRGSRFVKNKLLPRKIGLSDGVKAETSNETKAKATDEPRVNATEEAKANAIPETRGISGSSHEPRNWGKLVGMVMGIVAFFCFIYGFAFGFGKMQVKRLTLYVPDLPAAFEGYRIVQFSDIHLGSYYGWRGNLPQRDIDSINAQHADLICFTGDLQNVQPEEIEPYIPLMRTLRAKDGVLSVLGNHDYTWYLGIDDDDVVEKTRIEAKVRDIEKQMGWRLLNNEHVVLHRGTDSIYVAGTENYDKPKRTCVSKALYGIKPGQFVLMLQHIPKQWRETWPSTINDREAREKLSRGWFSFGKKSSDTSSEKPSEKPTKDTVLVSPQLTLSGHTHGGQISFLGLRPSMFTPYDYGLYEHEGRQLYTTSGLGGTIPIRLGATAEIVVITLKRK